MTTVLIIDSSEVVRSTLAQLLSWESSDVTLAAVCGSPIEARSLLNDGLEYDVALVDPALSFDGGPSLVAWLVSERPEQTVVAFTDDTDPRTVLSTFTDGARGFLSKRTPPDRLLAGLREAAAGGAPLTPSIARLVLDWVADPVGARPPSTVESLTPRENEVLSLLTRGETYARVADDLGIGIGTVQSHVKSIYRKLDVSSKTEAAALALARGLV